MIASLRGIVTEKSANHCVVETGGVGYRVSVSTLTARGLPDPGAEIFLYTRQVVREDDVQLYGFADLEERRLFELLITVSGVGPKVALALLSGLRPSALARALREENLAVLVGVPGVGRKTAERLVLELRDKLEIAAAAQAETAGARPSTDGPLSEHFQDAVAALLRLGYSQAQSQDALRQVSKSEENPSLEVLVRRALGYLSKTSAGVR